MTVMNGDAIEMDTYSEPVDIEVGQATRTPNNAVADWGESLLELDPGLAQLRFRMVPAKMSEETFWDVCFTQAAETLRDTFAGNEELFREYEDGLHRSSNSVDSNYTDEMSNTNWLEQQVGTKAFEALQMQGVQYAKQSG